MMNLFGTAKAIQEGNRVVGAFTKKSSKILWYCNGM